MQLSDGGGPDCSIDSPACSPNGSGSAPIDRLTDEKSPVTGDCHAGICGSRGVQFPSASRPPVVWPCSRFAQERVTLSMMVRSARFRVWRSSLVRPLKRRASNSRT
jgi:hypothetical protein